MKNASLATSFLLAAVMALTAGCRTPKTAEGEGEGTFDPNPWQDGPLGGEAGWEEGAIPGGNFQNLPRVETPAGVYPVYFAYNDSTIPAAEFTKIQTVAGFLKDNPGIVLVVEGNCDERGTNEYNMSLGEYRANAVRDALVSAGVSGDRIQTVSYGEERPAVVGSDEESWAQNRRAEFAFYQAK